MAWIDEQKWNEQPENKILDEREIKKIENINNTLSAAENAEGQEVVKAKINQVDNEFLNDINRQCNLILSEVKPNWGDDLLWDLTEEQSKAILTLLKIRQIQFPGSILAQITIDSKSSSVFNAIWTNPKVFKGILPDNVISYLDEKIKKKDETDRNAYKDEIIKWNIYETTTAVATESSDENPEVAAEKKVSPEKAKIYLQGFVDSIRNINQNITDKEIVKSNYEFVRNEAIKNDLFGPAVDALINKIYTDLSGTVLDLDDKMKSKKIEAFQKRASENPIYAEILWRWWLKKWWIDGVLWYNTLKAILDINQLEDWFKPTEKEVTVDNSLDKKREENWEKVNEAPLSIFNIHNLGDFWPDNEFTVSDKYIQREWDSKFVNIWGKRYFIEWWTDEDYKINQERTKYFWTDEKWNQIEMYKNVLTFWKIENWKFVEWTQITIDWNLNQIKMTKLDAAKIRRLWNEKVVWSLWVVNVWNKFDGERFNWKWRIDLFEDGKDTKRLNEEQLDSLDDEDLSRILDLAIDAYSSTWHKPSDIWQDNMNTIVYYIMKKSGWLWVGYLDAENARVKKISHMILWLNTWFYTNPSKELENDDLNKYTDKVILNRLGLSQLPEGYEDLSNRENVKKWDYIKNRLLILKSYLNINKDAFKR